MSAATATSAIADPIVGGKKTKSLSPAALKVAAQPIAAAWSPIVVAGVVRMIEFALIVAGRDLRSTLAYVVPVDGFEWHYVGAILGIAMLAMLAFQAADIYQVQAFRGYEKQYFRLASAWSVVFLLVIGATFFAKVGDGILPRLARHLLRRRPGRAGRLPTRRCSCWCAAGPREGRLDRRTVVVGGDERGEALIQALAAQTRFRRARRRRVRRPRRRALAARRSPAARSSAPSTTWSSSRAAPASIS